MRTPASRSGTRNGPVATCSTRSRPEDLARGRTDPELSTRVRRHGGQDRVVGASPRHRAAGLAAVRALPGPGGLQPASADVGQGCAGRAAESALHGPSACQCLEDLGQAVAQGPRVGGTPWLPAPACCSSPPGQPAPTTDVSPGRTRAAPGPSRCRDAARPSNRPAGRPPIPARSARPEIRSRPHPDLVRRRSSAPRAGRDHPHLQADARLAAALLALPAAPGPRRQSPARQPSARSRRGEHGQVLLS